jgi:hypothetical protein
MLTNGNHLGSYEAPSSEWSGGIIDARTHFTARQRLPYTFHDDVNISDNRRVLGFYQRDFLSISARDLNGFSLFMRDDGLKLYFVGTTNDSVYQYDLSVAYQIASATYIGLFAFGTTVVDPTAISFSPDGTKMLVLGNSADSVYSYTLSTPWLVSSATYDSVSFSVGTQEATPTGLFVKPDGTTFWVVGGTADTIFQYTMSTPWSLATAAYASVSASVGGFDTNPGTLCFNGDGTRLFVMGRTNNTIQIYSVATPWTVASVTNLGNTGALTNILPVGNNAGTTGLYFVPNTRHFYVLNATTDTIYHLEARGTTVIPGEVNATIFSNGAAAATLNIAAVIGTATSIQFRPDGKKFWVSDTTSLKIWEFDCPTPWLITGATTSTNSSYVVPTLNATAVGTFHCSFISPDGTMLFTLDQASGVITKWRLLKPWDLSASYFVEKSATVAGSIRNFYFSKNGLNLYFVTSTTNIVYQKTLTTAWGLSTLSATVSFTDSSFLSNTMYGINISQDGYHLYILGDSVGRVYRYKLLVPYSITGGFTEATHAYIENISPSSRGMFIKPDGSSYYIVDSVNDTVYQFNVAET